MPQPETAPTSEQCSHGNPRDECASCTQMHSEKLIPTAHGAPLETSVIEGEPKPIEVAFSTEAKEQEGRENEDAVLIDGRSQTYGVLDGIGGRLGGEVASRKGSEFIREAFAKMPAGMRDNAEHIANYLISAIPDAGKKLREMANANEKYRGMSSTLSLVHFVEHPSGIPREAVIAQVGDSRVYRFSAGKLERLTKDHSLIQEQIDAGALPPHADQIGDPTIDAQLTPEQKMLIRTRRNIITESLGSESLLPDVHVEQVHPDDVYLMITDGINDVLLDREIQDIARKYAHDPTRLSVELPRAARARSRDTAHIRAKDDDATAVVVRITGAAAAPVPAAEQSPAAPPTTKSAAEREREQLVARRRHQRTSGGRRG